MKTELTTKKFGRTAMKERIGEVNYNTKGSKMKILDYKTSKNVTVIFENGYISQGDYKEFKKGDIKSPYDKSLYNTGYLGEGKYICSKNSKFSNQYIYWSLMIKRCYSEVLHKKRPTYIGCTVCDEWHNFQNFGKWYDENYYKIEGCKMQLDKDILFKGNKIYSPENCVFVPSNINTLFIKCDSARGEYPIGITFNKREQIYVAQCKNKNGKRVIGKFLNPNIAFYEGYKPFKESYIKEIAEECKSQIPQNLYEAMYKYIVEITD